MVLTNPIRLTLYRPVDIRELRLVCESQMKAFPPRLPGQPIFYPVLNCQYASEITQQWNVTGPTGSGYVTRFEVDGDYVEQFKIQHLGAHHQELWIPALELDQFNKHLISPIEVTRRISRRISSGSFRPALVSREKMPLISFCRSRTP